MRVGRSSDQLYYLNTSAEHLESSEHYIVILVDTLLSSAITNNASDIHLEPTETVLRLRFRIDGMLYDYDPIIHEVAQATISRLKVLAGLDIAQKRVPQDGKLQVAVRMTDGQVRVFDLRVATFPALHGEKMVVRILDRTHSQVNIENLGFNTQIVTGIRQFLNRSHGFFLVTGPTGAGKTTTLYALLAQLNTPECNIITMEDPVEYHLAGITQSQVHCKAGFSFENGLRAILRQDPDVIMVGEIRDKQTVQMAMQAALTGHMVLSTLHTNSAIGAITRLLDMGIEPYLINASLTSVLAQRLVRMLCSSCAIPSDEDRARFALLYPDRTAPACFRAQGCNACAGFGHKGRRGVGELLIITDQLRTLIAQRAPHHELLAHAIKQGFVPLEHDLYHALHLGIISLDEFLALLHDA